MSFAATVRAAPRPKLDLSVIDQRVFLHGVPWEEYERLVELRGDDSMPRMTYLEGELKLMTPSRHREGIKKRLARLLETWGEKAGVELCGLGSWTIKERREERGAEADECYLIDPDPVAELADDDAWPQHPDLAIEVVWTSGGIPKLEVWRKLGVPEVWIWHADRLTLYTLRGDRYQEIPASELLPDLDLELLLRFLDSPQARPPRSAPTVPLSRRLPKIARAAAHLPRGRVSVRRARCTLVLPQTDRRAAADAAL